MKFTTVYSCIILVIFTDACFSQNILPENNDTGSIENFKYFAYTYQPSYILNNDTLAVARLSVPDSTLCRYLDELPVIVQSPVSDYAFLIAIKLFFEQDSQSNLSYDLCYAYKNPIFRLCINKIRNTDPDIDNMECFDITTYFVYQWAVKYIDQFTDPVLLSEISNVTDYLKKKYPDD